MKYLLNYDEFVDENEIPNTPHPPPKLSKFKTTMKNFKSTTGQKFKATAIKTKNKIKTSAKNSLPVHIVKDLADPNQ